MLLIFLILFLLFYYKNKKTGNTIFNQSEEKIIETVLNMVAYEAKLDVTIETNKNKTQYRIEQSMKNGISKQEVLEPENIAGVITEYDGTNLKIKNNKLNLETTFENYQYMVENRLWLDSFVQEDKKTGKPIKMIVQDINQKTLVYILYTEIKIS